MIDFVIVRTWQKMFAEHLELVAEGIAEELASPEAVCDDTACKLGQWLHGPGEGLAGLPAYAELDASHRRFHGTAGELLRAVREGRPCEDILAGFKAASAAVQAAIDRLETEFGARRGDLPYRSQFADHASPVIRAADGWDESLSVGVPAVDAHHKAIFEICGHLQAIPDALIYSEAATDALTELGRLLGMHFSIEEAYMRKLGMPPSEIEAHAREHTEILEQYAELNWTALMREKVHIRDIVGQVRRWAIDHVVDHDLAIKAYPRQPAAG